MQGGQLAVRPRMLWHDSLQIFEVGTYPNGFAILSRTGVRPFGGLLFSYLLSQNVPDDAVQLSQQNAVEVLARDSIGIHR